MAWQAEAAEDTTKKADKSKARGKDEKHPLFVKNLESGETKEFPNVGSYLFAEEKEVLVFISESKDSTFLPGVYVFNLKEENPELIIETDEKIAQTSVSKNGRQVAFLKENKKEKQYDLYTWNDEGSAKKLADNSAEALPENWEISENGNLSFSENGSRLFLGTAPKKPEKDTTILEEEIPVLDVWHWNEEVLQTEQINNKNRDSKKTYLAVVHLENNKLVQLETKAYTGVRPIKDGDSDFLLAWSNRP